MIIMDNASNNNMMMQEIADEFLVMNIPFGMVITFSKYLIFQLSCQFNSRYCVLLSSLMSLTSPLKIALNTL